MSVSSSDHGSELTAGFRQAMRRLASGVAIVVAMDGTEPVGLAATSITSLTMEPPAVLVCINQTASIHPSLAPGRNIGINLLSAHQRDVSAAFGGGVPREKRFETGRWNREGHALPVLEEAQATLLCTIETMTAYGTHSIVVARVEQVLVSDDIAPLIYQDGRYI